MPRTARRPVPLRQAHPVSPAARNPGPRAAGATRPLPVLVAALAVVLVAVVGGTLLAGASSPVPSSPTSGLVSPASGPPTGSPAPTATGPSPTPASSPTPAPVPTPVLADAAIVPVTNFRAAETGVTAADVRSIAAGKGRFAALVLVESDADGILVALGVDRTALGKRLVTVADAGALAADLAANRTRLGFLRADEVTAAVRALAWDGTALFGVDRVRSLAAWPLTATLSPAAEDAVAYDPATAWTLFAGGDVFLDRGVARAISTSKRGADYPFDGGTATITGNCKDCSPLGWDLPVTKRTGNGGVVRDLIRGADLAIANFENPAPDRWTYHAHGLVFNASPARIAGLVDAGFDWVSLANNHTGNAGRAGILQTIANLDRRGIASSGAGANTTEAHRAALLEAGGVTVGILGYDAIAPYYNATASVAGTARITTAALRADIAAARKAGADLVIVFPHWGVEYTATPTKAQRTLAHVAIDAGADMVIGNHPHWAGAMEVYKGKPIWYALGNFVFDQSWSEMTMEGITLELTFRGTELVQVRMRPHLILNQAQPNFLDPAGAGKVVMNQVFNASKGLLAW